MMKRGKATTVAVAVTLVATLIAGVVILVRSTDELHRNHFTAYFDNSNGIFPGDDVVILGVPVGKIDTIEPQPQRAKITFWVDEKYKVADGVEAVILSPRLITSRALQLTPAYTAGPTLAENGVIPQDRTAVPVEWDDFRQQLDKLSQALQPTQPGGVSPLGDFVNTTAANLDGRGALIRDTIIKLSQSISALGDHSDDIFKSVKNLATLVSALQSSADLMAQLNENLAAVTGLLSNGPDEVGRAVADINKTVGDVDDFLKQNSEAVGISSEKLAGITQALNDSIGDIKQTLHVAPNALQNFVNIYQPAHGSTVGALAVNNFANPISFVCGAIQAASRLNAEQSSKLCVQYLAPIIKNRQYNFPPIGMNPVVGTMARPNEVTYSEDWMRPDYRPTPAPPAEGGPPPVAAGSPLDTPVLPAEAPPPATIATDPSTGLSGLMVPPGGGS